MTRQSWNKGKHWPEDIKRKISESLKGRAPWNKGKVGLMPPSWHKGKRWSEEVRLKISRARKGQPTWNKGIPCSKEVKRKMSEAAIKRYANHKNVLASKSA